MTELVEFPNDTEPVTLPQFSGVELPMKGFADSDELIKLIANVDLEDPENLQRFNDWKINDGTKENLLKLKTL